jgi:hypothetical protein
MASRTARNRPVLRVQGIQHRAHGNLDPDLSPDNFRVSMSSALLGGPLLVPKHRKNRASAPVDESEDLIDLTSDVDSPSEQNDTLTASITGNETHSAAETSSGSAATRTLTPGTSTDTSDAKSGASGSAESSSVDEQPCLKSSCKKRVSNKATACLKDDEQGATSDTQDTSEDSPSGTTSESGESSKNDKGGKAKNKGKDKGRVKAVSTNTESSLSEQEASSAKSSDSSDQQDSSTEGMLSGFVDSEHDSVDSKPNAKNGKTPRKEKKAESVASEATTENVTSEAETTSEEAQPSTDAELSAAKSTSSAEASESATSDEKTPDAESSEPDSASEAKSGEAETSEPVSTSEAKSTDAESSGAAGTSDEKSTNAESSKPGSTSEAKTADGGSSKPASPKASSVNQKAAKAGHNGNGKWTISEDALLQSMKEGGETWANIAKVLSRGKKDCTNRWKNLQLVDEGVTEMEAKSVITDNNVAPNGKKAVTASDKPDQNMKEKTQVKESNEHNKSNRNKTTLAVGSDSGNDASSESPSQDASSDSSFTESYHYGDTEDGEQDDDWEKQYRKQQKFIGKHLIPSMYPPHMYPQPDRNFTERDCAVLAAIDCKMKASKFLEMQANFYNVTGQLVPLDLIKAKCDAAEVEEKKMATEARVKAWTAGLPEEGEQMDDPDGA